MERDERESEPVQSEHVGPEPEQPAPAPEQAAVAPEQPAPEPETEASSPVGVVPEPEPAELSPPEPLPDYYSLLGVPPDSPGRAIAEAYDRLSRELQPDQDVPPEDPSRVAEIDKAFDVLDNPASRAEYDRSRAIGAPPGEGRSLLKDRRFALALIAGGLIGIIAAAVFLLVDFSGDDGSEDDLVTTDTGLQYLDLDVGDGPKPNAGDQVIVDYVGMLEDGTVLADTRTGETPFRFILGQTAPIPGWDEGVAGMNQGGKRRLIVPPALAYGEQGYGNVIPPNATLVFEIELVNIRTPDQLAPASPPEVAGQEVATPSGLKYIDIVVGTGATPTPGQTATVHYTGWLQADGKKFDSSIDREEPIEFSIGQGNVIAGWDEGVATMRAGGKRRLIIPPELGYGAEGAPPVIPANAVLIFDVELLDVR